MGRPVSGMSGKTGNHMMVGALPGASGAQLIGKLIHDPHPNPQESPSKKSCIIHSIFSTALESNQSSIVLFEPTVPWISGRSEYVELFERVLYWSLSLVRSASVRLVAVLRLFTSFICFLMASGISNPAKLRVHFVY